jgi:hypothetical protein
MRNASLRSLPRAQRYGIHLTTRIAALLLLQLATTAPAIAQGPTWANPHRLPSPRSHIAAAYDSGRDRLVVFGGGLGTPSETWEHDGTSWILRTPSASPLDRISPWMAYDPQCGATLMTGAVAQSTAREAWLWDGEAWTRLPDLRAMVVNAFWHGGTNPGLYVLVDPYQPLPPFSPRVPFETYRWDGSSWVLSALAPHTMNWGRSTYVPATGLTYSLATGMWAFDGLTWQPVAQGPFELTGNYGVPDIVWDSGRNRLIVYDEATDSTCYGQLTSPLQVSWSRVSNANPFTGISTPSRRNYFAMAYDSRRHRPVLFGGMAYGIGVTNQLFTLQQTLAGSRWVEQTPLSQSPASRVYGDMAYDPGSDCMVLFGGKDANDNALNDTWIFDGLSWIYQGLSAAASPRLQPTIAHEPTLGTILFGGGTIGAGGNTVFNDTYRLANSNWVSANASGAPPARQGHDMVSAWNRLVVYGGYNGTALADTWSLNPNGSGMSWLRMLTLGSPGARQSHAMAFDRRRNCIVVFGGADANGRFLGDTWELTPATFGWQWTQRVTAHAPSRRWQHEMDYDPARGVVVMTGGYGNPQCGEFCAYNLNDVWEYDGTDWRQRQPSTSLPASREGAGFAYDSNRQRFVMQGGSGSVPFPTETWFYSAANDSFAPGMQSGSFKLRCTDFPVAGQQTGFAFDTPLGIGWLSVYVGPAQGPGLTLGPGLLCNTGTLYGVPSTILVDSMGFPGTTSFALPPEIAGAGFVVQGLSLESGTCLRLTDPMAVTVHTP